VTVAKAQDKLSAWIERHRAGRDFLMRLVARARGGGADAAGAGGWDWRASALPAL